MQAEIRGMIDLVRVVYPAVGFDLSGIVVKLATRPPKSLGTDEQWHQGEEALATALREEGFPFEVNPGEGAFYGPKIEFHVTDALGRTWQCGTIQVDYSMPDRFGLEYTGRDGNRHVPVMIHRAILGSFERLVGVLIEHHAGKLPLWLAPVQAKVLTITEAQNDYASGVVSRLQAEGLRVESDLRGDKIGAKIREGSLERVPYLLVAGAKEAASGQVAVRERGGKDLGPMPLEAFLALARERLQART
jgi:threonyl-tRNA synthetase